MWDLIRLLVNTTVFAATLRMATPLLFTAVGGIFSNGAAWSTSGWKA